MSSDVVLYTTVAAVTAAAAGVGGYLAFRGSGENPDDGCEYEQVPSCDIRTNTLSYVRTGKPTNDPSCPPVDESSPRVPSTTPCEGSNGLSLDCATTPWSDWSNCDCNLKLATRSRTITRQASVGGAACGPLVETQDCASSCNTDTPPSDAPTCAYSDERCTPANPCSPARNADGVWECQFRCNQNRIVACDPLYEEEVCAVPHGSFGQFSCDEVCDLSQKPDCVKPGCCKNAAGCIVKIEAANGLSQLTTVEKGEWYCEDPCANQLAPTCGGTDEAACVLGVTGHRLQCVSKCRTLTRPAVEFAQDLTCKVDTFGKPSYEVSSMCAGKPMPVCPSQARTAATPQCLLTDAALAKPAGSAYTSADFDWKCTSPCGNEPPCATVPGITPMVCAQDPVNGTFQWTGTCIRNVDVEKCGPYLCSSNETAYCTTSRAWTSCVDSSCKPNPDPNYACPAPGADPLIDYKELCDPVTKVVICKPQCKPQPPASLILDPKTQYPFCGAETGFRYEARNYGDTMCSAVKPRPNFRCVPGDNGWNWVDENVYMANRWQYVDYIQRQAVFAPYRLEAVNADNPTGPKVTVLCQDVECKAPISPTIGVDCIGSAKVAKALEGALGNPIGNLAKTNPALAQVDGNLTYFPRDASKRQYYRPNRDNFDLVCPLTGSLLPTCSNNGSFTQTSSYNPAELISAVKPYSGSLTGACSCRAGFLGPNCQYSNDATCSQSKGTVDATGKCTCLTGFAGSACQFPQSRCGAAALSISTTADGSYACSCPAGYYGTNSDGKSACLHKDAVLLSSPICRDPCGGSTLWQIGACSPSEGSGKSCTVLAGEFCATSLPGCALFPKGFISIRAAFNNSYVRVRNSDKAVLYQFQCFYLDGVTNILYMVAHNSPTSPVEFIDTTYRVVVVGSQFALKAQTSTYVVLDGRSEPFSLFTSSTLKVFSPPIVVRATIPSASTVRGGCQVAVPDGHVITGILVIPSVSSSRAWGFRSKPLTALASQSVFQSPAEGSNMYGYASVASPPGYVWVNAPNGHYLLPRVEMRMDAYGIAAYRFFFSDDSSSDWVGEAGRGAVSYTSRGVTGGTGLIAFKPIYTQKQWMTATGIVYNSAWVEVDVQLESYSTSTYATATTGAVVYAVSDPQRNRIPTTAEL